MIFRAFFGGPFFGGEFFSKTPQPGGSSRRDKRKKRIAPRYYSEPEYEPVVVELAPVEHVVALEDDDDELILVLATVIH